MIDLIRDQINVTTAQCVLCMIKSSRLLFKAICSGYDENMSLKHIFTPITFTSTMEQQIPAGRPEGTTEIQDFTIRNSFLFLIHRAKLSCRCRQSLGRFTWMKPLKGILPKDKDLVIECRKGAERAMSQKRLDSGALLMSI